MLQPEDQSSVSGPVGVDIAAISSTLQVTGPELVNIKDELLGQQQLQYLPVPSDINQSTNTTITTNQQRPIPCLTLPAAPPSIPSGKIIRYCPKHPAISVTLDGKQLWDDFYHVGTFCG